MGFRGQFWIINDADKHARGLGLMECFEYPHGIAVTTAARVIGDVGQDRCGQVGILSRRDNAFDRVLKRRQPGHVAFMVGPGFVSNVTGQRLCNAAAAPGSDNDGETVLGRVAVGEPAENGNVGNVLRDEGLAVIDNIGIRSVLGQKGHGRRSQRQADKCRLRVHAREHFQQNVSRFNPALAHVDMGIGAVGDDGVRRLDHAFRHVAVQIERRHHGNVRSDDGPYHGEDFAIRVPVFCGDHGAVIGNIDRIQRHRRLQSCLHILEGGLEKGMVHWPAGLDQTDQNGNRRPVAVRIDGAEEAANFGRQLGIGTVQVFEDFVPREVHTVQVILLGGHRSEAIAFEQQA